VGGYAAVILAGGAGRRLGGVDKPMLAVGGRPMLARVLDAVADAAVRVVVGPPTLSLPDGVVRVSEEPPGGGPVAAAAAGLAALKPGAAPAAAGSASAASTEARDSSPEAGDSSAEAGWPTVALLAADLPFLDSHAIGRLRDALATSTMDGVVFVDSAGHRQTLCGVWRTASLRAALDRVGPPAGVAVRALLAGLSTGELHLAAQPPPWYDCDEPDDLLRAEEWTHERP
jgi:molybdenum cofactor guanylyltransferase